MSGMPNLGGSVEAMGAMNALKTGNVMVDMAIAMVIPVIFKIMFDQIAKLTSGQPIFSGDFEWAFWRSKYDTRAIEHKVTQNTWGDTTAANADQRNNVLIKAIQMFLDKNKVGYKLAQVSLMSLNEVQKNWWGGDMDDDKENTPAGKLKKYRLTNKPPENVWCPLGTYGKGPTRGGVDLRVEENEQDKGEKAEKTKLTTTYRLRSRTAGAIDSFIQEAYDWYLNELRSQEDDSRYLYELQIKDGGAKSQDGEGSDNSRVYKRYKLSDEKTFQSLFFDEKDKLLALLKHFTSKSGKYAIQGYPHKVGLLLHGPPGTGKTSLIKALAQHTRRSIVNVPLARITTNQELMDIMFDQQYCVHGDEVPIKLGFKDVIFVMEDVDAASKVVHRRDGKTGAVARAGPTKGGKHGTSMNSKKASKKVKNAKSTSLLKPPSPLPPTPWQLMLQSADSEVQALVKVLREKSPRFAAASTSPELLHFSAAQLRPPQPLPPPPPPKKEDEDEEDEEAKKKAAALALAVANKTHAELSEEAAQRSRAAMTKQMEACEAVDKFVAFRSAALKKLLDAGAEVDTALEDELLRADPDPVLAAAAAAAAANEEEEDEEDELPPMPGGPLLRRETSLGYSGAGPEEDEEEEVGGKKNKKGAGSGGGGSDDEDEEGGGPDVGLMMATMMSMMPGNGGSGGDGGGGGGADAVVMPGPMTGASSWSLRKDKLNLSGLLNVLDGVVDTPERIVVMTTNHPERLDPALIRPGRIDKKILLSYMGWGHIVSMIEHYFQVTGGMSASHQDRVRDAVLGNDAKGLPALNLTPAQVEQLSAEHDELEDMIVALECKGIGVLPQSASNIAAAAGVAGATAAAAARDKRSDGGGLGPAPATLTKLSRERSSSTTVTFE